jgi:hypothetical protein
MGAPDPQSRQADDRAILAFARSEARPRTTFPLVLTAVVVSVVSMSIDAVARYSTNAFFAGIVLSVLLATLLGKTVDRVKAARWRLVASLLLPTALGAMVGTAVQAVVLHDVVSSSSPAVKDLGGLVDTTDPVRWIAAGTLLGGVPALLVSVFLVLAARSLERLAGHDASESFGVAFSGVAGLLGAFGLLVVVEGIAAPPLYFVVLASALSVLVALVVDSSRIRFLRRVYAGQGGSFDIVPSDRFANDPALAPIVANAKSSSVLVRITSNVGSYRATAAEPIALVGDTERETLRPLLRRRAAAIALLGAMTALTALSFLTR